MRKKNQHFRKMTFVYLMTSHTSNEKQGPGETSAAVTNHKRRFSE